MEFLQLKYFCEAARVENFSVTAKRFGVPASAVSQSIKRLEDELGIELFVRRSNKIFLSEKGSAFYKKVASALEIIDGAREELKDDKSGKISLCINANRRLVMQTAERFCKLYPDAELSLSHLQDGVSLDADMIVSVGDEEYEGYSKIPLLNESIGVALLRNNKLFKKADISFKDFENEPFVTMPSPSSLYNLLHGIASDFGFKPKISVLSDDPFYVRKCVELGLGSAVIPSLSWKGQFSDCVGVIPLEGYTRATFLHIK